MQTTVTKARDAILRAANKNPHITPAMLREELVRGSVGGWLCLSAVRACTLSEWSVAMEAAAQQLDRNQQAFDNIPRNYNASKDF